jgi:hypothetical protein
MLLQVPNTYALVLSTENITQNMYKGTQRSMLIPNVLFRVGGAAMLLTNKRSEARWVGRTTAVVSQLPSGLSFHPPCVPEPHNAIV